MNIDSEHSEIKDRNIEQINSTADNPKHALSVEELFRQSNRILIETLNKLQDGVFAVNKDWEFTYVNKKAAEFVGFKPEDLIRKNFWQTFPLTKGTVLEENYKAAAETQKIRSFETKGIYSSKYFQATVYPSKEGTIVILHDITKRKSAEEALRKSEEEYSSLFSNMIDGFAYCQMIFDDEGKPVDFVYLQINDAFEQITGLKTEIVIGKKVTEAIPGIIKGNPELFEIYGRVATTCQKEKFEIFFKPLNMWLSISVYCPSKGYFAAIFEDITEHKKAEEALKTLNDELEERVQQRTAQVSAERERLYNVLETLPSYVILLDRDYHVAFANKVFRETFGEDHGRRCYEYLFGKDYECENCETYKVYRENKPQHWYWTGPNGHNYDIYDFPFKEADGSTLILEMGIDITEQRKAEKQLKEVERLASIGATAGMIGHDIRNPLQAIIGDVYLLKDYLTALPETAVKNDIAESLEEIEKNIGYINKIVADLQDYSRTLTLELRKINLYSFVIDTFRTIEIPENVAPSIEIDSKISLKTDCTLLTRILTNLIINSIQAMPNGGRLTILAIQKQGKLVLSVEDTGTGIPEHVKPKLFTPMMTTKAKGQGLGLAVVKRMSEALGGTVTFESEEGKGTKFIIELPTKQ